MCASQVQAGNLTCGNLYQITEPIAAWANIRTHLQTLRLAVENHRA